MHLISPYGAFLIFYTSFCHWLSHLLAHTAVRFALIFLRRHYMLTFIHTYLFNWNSSLSIGLVFITYH